MIPQILDEETARQMLDEIISLVYDHTAKLRKDQHEVSAIESGTFKERTGL